MALQVICRSIFELVMYMRDLCYTALIALMFAGIQVREITGGSQQTRSTKMPLVSETLPHKREGGGLSISCVSAARLLAKSLHVDISINSQIPEAP